VRRDDMVALRRKVVATVDTSIAEDAADVTATLRGGRTVHVRVDHAIGSLERPLSDAQLEAKFHSLGDAVIGSAKAAAAIEACWNLGAAGSLQDILRSSRP